MFVETITAPREEWESWTERLRVHSEPPDALVASIAWSAEEGMVTSVNVWDTPEAVADFYIERVGSIVQAEGEPANKPEPHGKPIAVYIRL
jgi:hypothetical protein